MADYNKSNEKMEENKYKGQFKIEKKSLAKRAIDFLFSDKIDNIGNYIVYDVLGPTIRDLIYKSFVGAIGMAVYGSVRDAGNPLEQRYSGARRDYSAMSRPGPAQFNVQTQVPPTYGYGIYDITFDTKDIALYHLDRLQAYIAQYGKVRVKDFYDDVGYTPPTSNWALSGAGWYNLDYVTAVPTSNGRWIIDFPPPVSIAPVR